MTERPFFTTAEAMGTNPVEMFSLEAQRDRLIISSTADLRDEVRNVLDNVPQWLPVASEVLGISRDLKDYILVPVISMPSDLPNRNQQGFPFKELTGWCVDAGCPMYKTWIGKPTFLEHDNKDPTKAKGIIMSSMMRRIPNTSGDIWKVIKLLSFDRNRDPDLANKILTREMNSYSMGAYSRDYQCTVCGELLSKTPQQNGCEHVKFGQPNYKLYNGKIAYHAVSDAIGFETSAVTSPAYYSAKDQSYFQL
jgi:hypothetical protein